MEKKVLIFEIIRKFQAVNKKINVFLCLFYKFLRSSTRERLNDNNSTGQMAKSLKQKLQNYLLFIELSNDI